MCGGWGAAHPWLRILRLTAAVDILHDGFHMMCTAERQRGATAPLDQIRWKSRSVGPSCVVEPPLLAHPASPTVSWHSSMTQARLSGFWLFTRFPSAPHLADLHDPRHFKHPTSNLRNTSSRGCSGLKHVFLHVSHWKVFYLVLTHTLTLYGAPLGWISWIAWPVARSRGFTREIFDCGFSLCV